MHKKKLALIVGVMLTTLTACGGYSVPSDQAEAEVAVEKARADKQLEVIRGYGGTENYLIAQCIATPGCAPFQPTYVVGGTVPAK